MSEKSPWADALGPVCTVEHMTRKGFLPMLKSLASITVSEGDELYLQRQFTVNPDGSYTLKSAANDFWFKHTKPAIEKGTMDAYMANAHFFSIGEDEPSIADQIMEATGAGDTETLAEIEWDYEEMLWRFSQ